MTIRFFSKSETHREFSNFAPFPIDLDATGEEELAEAAPTDYHWGIGRDGSGLNKALAHAHPRRAAWSRSLWHSREGGNPVNTGEHRFWGL
jgi:predicted NAD-dependent protein-ADP-ribosyltransferase YbiA (DUF1768 family)